MMDNLLLIGNSGFLNNQLDGQTVKIRNIKVLLEQQYKGQLYHFDTSFLHRNPLLLLKMVSLILICKTVIIVPADGFLAKLFPPIYYITKLLGKSLIHLGVGGWQKEFFIGQEGKFDSHPKIMGLCKRIKVFMVEIENVKNDLQSDLHFTNLDYFPNFRFFDYQPSYSHTSDLLRLVYMGRIESHKGYEIMGKVIADLEAKGLNVTLDFYGQIEDVDKDHFNHFIKSLNSIEYKGLLSPENIYTTLGHYDVMVFPTRYYTEGFPGTVLDAYISGIPVIATNWKHAHEFVKDTKSGYVVNFDNPAAEFVEKIEYLYYNPNLLEEMKHGAHEESNKYSSENAWNIINKYL